MSCKLTANASERPDGAVDVYCRVDYDDTTHAVLCITAALKEIKRQEPNVSWSRLIATLLWNLPLAKAEEE